MNQERSKSPGVPKPYAFVPFAGQVKRQEVPGHDQVALSGHYSGRLVYRLQTLTPLFISDGSYALGEEVGLPDVPVIRPFYRVAGRPTVPGSSLKGMARTIVEAISPSCITITRVAPGHLPAGVESSQRSACTPTHACPACSLFGRIDQQGKARFGDASLLGSTRLQTYRLAPLFAPRTQQAPKVYLDQRNKFKGLKFYQHSQPNEAEHQPPVEVIPVGREVEGQVDFENLTSAELGLLFFALGMDSTLALKLGGGKPLGLGSLKLVAAELSLLPADHYVQAESQESRYSGQALAQFVGQQIETALNQGFLLPDQVMALARILTYKRKRQAPEGAY